MRKLTSELQLLNELECDQHDIAKLKEQRLIVSKIQQALTKKD